MIYIGTSGFKFPDWKGPFYPETVKEKDWLTYYAERFNCLEVNSSYYRLMHPATFFHMAAKTPESFQFTVKTYRTLTHEIGGSSEEDFKAFKESIQPLIEVNKFGCILAQFPSSFHNTPGNRDYLSHFFAQFPGLALVVEFRNREWIKDPVFELLRQHQVGWCAVDEPQFKTLMPPLAIATSPIGYVRFHGRNYQKWWKVSDTKERYDYLYSRDELIEWVPKIQKLEEETERVFVFMNNCFQGKAAQNALQMRELLGETAS